MTPGAIEADLSSEQQDLDYSSFFGGLKQDKKAKPGKQSKQGSKNRQNASDDNIGEQLESTYDDEDESRGVFGRVKGDLFDDDESSHEEEEQSKRSIVKVSLSS